MSTATLRHVMPSSSDKAAPAPKDPHIVFYATPLHTLSDFLHRIDVICKAQKRITLPLSDELYDKFTMILQEFRQNNPGIYIDANVVKKHMIGVIVGNMRASDDPPTAHSPRRLSQR